MSLKKLTAAAFVAIALAGCSAEKPEASTPYVASKSSNIQTSEDVEVYIPEVKKKKATPEAKPTNPVKEQPVVTVPEVAVVVPEVVQPEVVVPPAAVTPAVPVTPVEVATPVIPAVPVVPVPEAPVVQPEPVVPEPVIPAPAAADNWAEIQLANSGYPGITVEFGDTVSLCGADGGCAIVGSPYILMNSTYTGGPSAAANHVLYHELSHTLGETSECNAEYFSHSMTGDSTLWSYASCAK